MNRRGIALSLEALVAFLLLMAVVVAVEPPTKESLAPLILKQKQHDLLTHWAKKSGEALEAGTLRSDFEKLFPGQGGEIVVNGTKASIGIPREQRIQSLGYYVTKDNQWIEIRLTNYY